MKIFIINGIPKSGKDTFVDFIKKNSHGIVYNLSTVDLIKEVAKVLGWDGVKTPTSREFLSNLKDLSTNFNNFPFECICREVECIKTNHKFELTFNGKPLIPYVFIHSREPDEIQRFKDKLGAKSLEILRPIENQSYVHSDQNTSRVDYDYRINNNGNLEDLHKSAIDLIDLIGGS